MPCGEIAYFRKITKNILWKVERIKELYQEQLNHLHHGCTMEQHKTKQARHI